MPRVNLATLDRLEASEARQRKQTSQNRAIRRAKHQASLARARACHLCSDCREEANVLMAAIQVSLKAGRQ